MTMYFHVRTIVYFELGFARDHPVTDQQSRMGLSCTRNWAPCPNRSSTNARILRISVLPVLHNGQREDRRLVRAVQTCAVIKVCITLNCTAARVVYS